MADTNEIIWESGFSFACGNLLSCLTESDIADIPKLAEEAHAKVRALRSSGRSDGVVVKFTELPYVTDGHCNTPALMRRLEALRERSRTEYDLVVNIGIGGSYLGNRVIFDLCGGEFRNSMSEEERNGYPKALFVGNNVDAKRLSDCIAYIRRDAKRAAERKRDALVASGGNGPLPAVALIAEPSPYKVLLHIISKSGDTIEPSAAMAVTEAALQEADIDYEVIATTGEGSALDTLAREKGRETYRVPDGVGGRFSVFSEVGLVFGALIGFDIESFLRGAADADAACRSERPEENPALLNAVLKYLLAERHGYRTEIIMPYADGLKSFAEWYVQLLSESLGKTRADGTHYGRTPSVAVGTTDMHAQTQEHQEGISNKIVQFVALRSVFDGEEADIVVPDMYPGHERLRAGAGIGMTDILHAAREANAEALSSAGRPHATYTLPKPSAYHMGALMYLLMLSVCYEGFIAGVNAFDQPGVEVYKMNMRPKLEAKRKETSR